MQRNNQTNDPFSWVGFGSDLPNNNNTTKIHTTTKPPPKVMKSKGPSMNQINNTSNNNNTNNSDPLNANYDPFHSNNTSVNTNNNNSFNTNTNTTAPFTDAFDNLWSDDKPIQKIEQKSNAEIPQKNTYSSTTNHDTFMDFDSLFTDNNSNKIPPNTNTDTQTNETTDFDNLWSDTQPSKPIQSSQPSQAMDLNFLFTDTPVSNTTKKSKKKKQKKGKKPQKYDEDIIKELVNLGLGTKQECINASLKCVNYKDINEVTEKLKKLQNKSVNNSYLKGYNNKNLFKSQGCPMGFGRTEIDIQYSKGDIIWSSEYSSSDFDGGNISKIYERINQSKRNGTCKVYTKDIDPDHSPLLVDINNGELHFFVPLKGKGKFASLRRFASYKSDDNSDDDDMKLDPTFDPFAPIPKHIKKVIKLVKELDTKKEAQTIDVRDYKKKKYDGIVSYLGFLIGLSMAGTELKVKESHSFNVKKTDPFLNFEKDWKRGSDSQKKRINNEILIGQILLTEEVSEGKYGGMFAEWEKLNSLEKKVYLLKWFMYIGTDLIRVSDEDIYNVREMDSEDIDAQNALLNGGFEDGFGGMMAGMMAGMVGGDSDGEVDGECKQM